MGNSSSQQKQPEPPTNRERLNPLIVEQRNVNRRYIERRIIENRVKLNAVIDEQRNVERRNIENREKLNALIFEQRNIKPRIIEQCNIENREKLNALIVEQRNIERRYIEQHLVFEPPINNEQAKPPVNNEKQYTRPNTEQRPVFKPPINNEAKPPVNNENRYTRPNTEQRPVFGGLNIEQRRVFKPPTNNEQAKPPVNNKQAGSSNRDEATIAAVTAPRTFITKDDFMATWFSWKEEFIAYVASIDKTGSNNSHIWCRMLLNRMGPVGQEIHRTFPFYDKNAQDAIKLLCRNFDVYCLYGDKKRGDEDIDKYVNDLKLIAVARNYSNPEIVVKEKIIQDINGRRFTGKAARAVESKGEKWIPYLQTLCLSDVIFLWKQLEDSMTPKNKETPKQDPPCAKSAVACFRCGTEHNRNQCPAWGTQCNKCKQFNHFTDNCRVIHVNDCTKCGKSHFLSRCPAFGKVCTNCGKRNHFSSKCRIPFVNNKIARGVVQAT